MTGNLILVSPISSEAFEVLGDFEVMLRRLVRWELRARFGRRWLVELEYLAEVIENNRRGEVRRGFQDRASSELSYLALTDLFKILAIGRFNFSRFMSGTRIPRLEQDRIASVRNRVAHFRRIGQSELTDVQKSRWVLTSLRNYFSSDELEYFELHDPASGSSESANNQPIKDYVMKRFKAGVLERFSEYEQSGREGFKTSIGIYDRHFYILGYCSFGHFDPLGLLDWIPGVHDRVTLLKVGAVGQYVRVFVPVVYEEIEINKTFRGAVSVMRQAVRPECVPNSATMKLYSEFESEYLLCESAQSNVAFAL